MGFQGPSDDVEDNRLISRKSLDSTQDASLSAANVTSSNTTKDSADVTPWYLRHFSEYNQIVKLVTWMRHLLFNSLHKSKKQQTETGDITSKEWREAESLSCGSFSQRV